MAKAKLVEKPRKPRKPCSYINLRLTFEEAETLRFVCGFIGGTGNTPRRDMTAIAGALDQIDVEIPDHQVDRNHRSIYFLESDGYSMATVWGIR